MRKGQIVSQVFIFALAAIIFGFILLIGFRAIGTINKRAELASLTKFDSEFEAKVESIKLSYGSSRRENLPGLPGKYRTLCILPSKSEDLSTADQDAFRARHGQLYNDWFVSAGTDNPFNLLIDPKPSIGHLGAADMIVEGKDGAGYCCLDLSGPLIMRFEGLGNRAKVSPWDPEVTPCKP
jgi:hypothetical protein